MAYIRKIIAHDENLIGIARLHWIYVLKGLFWFLALAGAGWVMDALITRGLYMIAQTTGANTMAVTLMSISNGAMMFMMGAGLFIFFLLVLKVLVTEVGLSSRRIMVKEGLIFVKVQQIDLEEIRGENMDSGYFGRLLGYAYIMLDCRFIGDVRLPAIESPERFMRALHQTRGATQDTLAVVLGKGNPMPVGHVEAATDGPDTPQPATPAPTPEILPGQQPAPEVNPPNTPQPEINPPPVPHAPPTQPSTPQTPPPQPAQPIPPPINPEPPLQPPTGQQPLDNGKIVPAVVAQSVNLPPEAVAQVVQQVMPQMAQQVVKEMANQGLIHPEEPANEDIGVDTDLIDSFDDARLNKGGDGNDLRDKVEYAIH